MNIIARTVAWEFIARSPSKLALALAGAMLPMVFYYAVGSTDPKIVASGWLVLEIVVLPTILLLLMFISFGLSGQGFRLYVRPLSNIAIAGCQAFPGAVFMALSTLLIASLYNYVFQAGWPVLGAACFAAALWFAVQPVLCVGLRSPGRLLITSIPIAICAFWYLSRYGAVRPQNFSDWTAFTGLEALTLAIISLVSFVWHVGLVEADRCGDMNEMPDWEQKLLRFTLNSVEGLFGYVLKPLLQQFEFQPRAENGFHAFTRRLWVDGGRVLPILVAVFSILGSFILSLCFWVSVEQRFAVTKTILLVAPELICILAAGSAISIGMNSNEAALAVHKRGEGHGQNKGNSSFGSFNSCLPLSDQQIGLAYIRNIASSVGNTWIVYFLGCCTWLIAGTWWGIDTTLLTPEVATLYLPFAIASSWIFASTTLTIMVCPMPKRIASTLVSSILVCFVVASLIKWGAGRAIDQTAQCTLLAVLLTGTIFGNAVAYRVAIQAKLVSMPHAISVLSAAIFLAFAYLLLPWVSQLPQVKLIWLCVASVSALPFATVPIALYANRHR